MDANLTVLSTVVTPEAMPGMPFLVTRRKVEELIWSEVRTAFVISL